MLTRKSAARVGECLCAALFGLSLPVWAGTEQDAARLGKSLTPLGGELKGQGSIPDWEDGDKAMAGWAPGKVREQFWRHKDEKPLLTLDQAGAEAAADRLTPGQQQLFKKNAGYRMTVYPSHRSCTAPAWVQENTRRNVAQASLSADGHSLTQAVLPGVPFPVPTTGAQVIWNFQMRYQGVGVEWPKTSTLVSPPVGSNSPWIEVEGTQNFFFPWGAKGSQSPKDVQELMANTYYAINAPTALAGQALVGAVSLSNKGMEVNYYFPGQRRVRRMPSYAYDAPQIGFENQYTIDQTQMFTGNIDRYDWKLLGKKEIYVPYNTFKLFDFKAKRAEAYQAESINAAFRRYELHRVWVVEAKVKAGMRHTAARKLFYIDEDSWLILVGEDYDAQGVLWKLREASVIPVWELDGACASSSFMQMDLLQGRYLADFVTLGAGVDVRWHLESKDKRFTPGFYTADQLRAISER